MRPLSSTALALVIVTSGCYSTRSRTVVPREILRHVPSIRDQGQATVDTVDGTPYLLKADHKVRIEIEGDLVSLPVGELVADCPDIPPFATDRYRREKPCHLLDTITSQIHLESTEYFDKGDTRTLINTSIFLGGGVALGVCLSECNSEGKIISGVGLGALALYGIVLAFAHHNSR